MEKNKIIISVAGYSATGKSTISEIISIALKNEGFNTEIINIDDVDDEKNGENQAFIRKNLKKAISSIIDKTDKVVIKEVQLKHSPLSNNNS